MKRILYSTIPFLLIFFSACNSYTAEDEALGKKQLAADSMYSKIAFEHKVTIMELLELLKKDTTGWNDSICEIKDLHPKKLSFTLYKIIEPKKDSTTPVDALDRLIEGYAADKFNSPGYYGDDLFSMSYLGQWLEYNKKINSPYVVFVQSISSALPEIQANTNEFEAGYVLARLSIVNYETKKIVCSYRFLAQSTPTLSYSKGPNELGAMGTLYDDLKVNVQKEIRSSLIEKTGCDTIKIAGFEWL